MGTVATETESKEFRVRYSIGWFIFLVAIILMMIHETILSNMAIIDYLNPSGRISELPFWLIYRLAIHILPLIFAVSWLIQNLIEQKQSRVLLDEQNLSFINWRGRERVFPLSEIQELRVYPRVLGGPMSLVVKTKNKKLGLPVHLVKNEELKDIIIARGRLTNEREGWYSTRYRREG